MTGVFTWWTEVAESNVDGKVADLTELRKRKLIIDTGSKTISGSVSHKKNLYTSEDVKNGN